MGKHQDRNSTRSRCTTIMQVVGSSKAELKLISCWATISPTSKGSRREVIETDKYQENDK